MALYENGSGGDFEPRKLKMREKKKVPGASTAGLADDGCSFETMGAGNESGER